MKNNWFHRSCALVCVLVISGVDTTAALNAYLKADGIPGDSVVQKWENFVEVSGYNHEVMTPVDLQTGQPTGKRQHRPFKILKRVTANSPLFLDHWVKNLPIANAELKLVRPDQLGREEVYYVYRFTNVRIISVRDWMANNLDSTAASYPNLQEISFTYQGIEWEALPNGPIATDSTTGGN